MAQPLKALFFVYAMHAAAYSLFSGGRKSSPSPPNKPSFSDSKRGGGGGRGGAGIRGIFPHSRYSAPKKISRRRLFISRPERISRLIASTSCTLSCNNRGREKKEPWTYSTGEGVRQKRGGDTTNVIFSPVRFRCRLSGKWTDSQPATTTPLFHSGKILQRTPN